jgi:predicted MFS family arabinose efflux permease
LATFAAFRYRNFRLIWLGNLTSNVGSWMQRVAQPWLVLAISHSPFLLGLDAFAADVPLLALLLVGGAVADRSDRRLIITVSQIVQMSSALLIAALVFAGRIHVWEIIALSVVVGTAQAFSIPAYGALIPALVEREHVGNAIALNSAQFNTSRVLGPVLAGIVMAGLGAGWCFALNAVSFLALIYAVHAIAIPRNVPAPRELSSLRSGIRAILGDRELAALLMTVSLSSMFSGPILTFIPVLARDVYGVGPGGFSTLLAIFGLGALAGAMGVARLGSGRNAFRSASVSAGLLALAVLAIAFVKTIVGASVLLWLGGVAFIGCNAIANTELQTRVPDHLRGRASSVFVLSFRGALPVGNLLTGLTVDRFGVSRALALNGFLALASVLAIAVHEGGFRPASPPSDPRSGG